MKAQTNIFGRIVKRYDMSLEDINDLNIKYEEHRKKLESFASLINSGIFKKKTNRTNKNI